MTASTTSLLFKAVYDIDYTVPLKSMLLQLSASGKQNILQDGLSKTKLDLYFQNSPSSSSSGFGKNNADVRHSKSLKPLVIFFHGGGWRRGHTQNWRHFLSRFDTNLMMSALCKWNNHYGIVGEGFTKLGYPCAVVTYPLIKPTLSVLFLETVTSLSMSSFLCAVPSVILYKIISAIMNLSLLYGKDLYNISNIRNYFAVLSNMSLPAKLISLLGISQCMTIFLLLFNLQNYLGISFYDLMCFRKSSNKLEKTSLATGSTGFIVCLLWKFFRKFHSLRMEQHVVLMSLSLTLLVQSIILLIQLRNWVSNSSDYAKSLDEQAMYVAKAVKWLVERENNGIYDPESIVLCGHSAGGHLASLLALDSKYLGEELKDVSVVKGVIAISGVYDPQEVGKSLLARYFYFNSAFGPDKVKWASHSPLKLLARENRESTHRPNFLLISAEKDFQLKKDAMRFGEALKMNNYTCEEVEIPSTNHFNVLNDFGAFVTEVPSILKRTLSSFMSHLDCV